MANNRMWLRCARCGDKFHLAKYYPSTGWYINRLDLSAVGADLDAWFEAHRHEPKTMFGEEVQVIRESDPVPEANHP